MVWFCNVLVPCSLRRGVIAAKVLDCCFLPLKLHGVALKKKKHILSAMKKQQSTGAASDLFAGDMALHQKL